MLLPATLTAMLACLAINLWAGFRIGHAQQLLRDDRAEAAAILARRQVAAATFRGNALVAVILVLLLELESVGSIGLAMPVAFLSSLAAYWSPAPIRISAGRVPSPLPSPWRWKRCSPSLLPTSPSVGLASRWQVCEAGATVAIDADGIAPQRRQRAAKHQQAREYRE